MASKISHLRNQARLAGWFYLYIIVAGIFTEAIVRGQIIDVGNAAATAQNIASDTGLYRTGLLLEMLVMVADIVVAVIFYRLFRALSPTLSMLALVFRLVTVVFAAFKVIALAAPVVLLANAASLSPVNVEAMSLVFLKLNSSAYSMALFFFGIDCLIIGYLLWRSESFPQFLGAGLGLAGICYMVITLANLLLPALASLVFPFILLPCLVAEVALTVWLILFGVRRTDDAC